MKTKEYKLENGIIVRDAREIQCGVWIEGHPFNYFTIYWNSIEGLRLISINSIIDPFYFNEYQKELHSAMYTFNQINQLLNDNRTN